MAEAFSYQAHTIDEMFNNFEIPSERVTDFSSAVSQLVSNRPASATVTSIWTGTQAEYDAVSPKTATTLYFIKA